MAIVTKYGPGDAKLLLNGQGVVLRKTQHEATVDINWQNSESSGTITFSLRASEPIVTGTFLDGSPWVSEASGLELVSVTPAQSTLSGEGAFSGRVWHTNNTIINPDFGRLTINTEGAFAAEYTKTFGSVTAGDPIPDSSGFRSVNPLEGRIGSLNDNSDFTENLTIYSDQRWDDQPISLAAGDQVVKVISRITTTGGALDNGIGLPDVNNPMMHWIGVLSVVSSADASVAANRFRPPVVWSVADKANRPLLSDNGFSYSFNGLPSVDLFGDAADYSSNTTLDNKTSWFDDYTNSVLIYPALTTSTGHGGDPSLRDTRNSVPLGVSGDIYGLAIAKKLEAMSVALFDSSIDSTTSNTIRRIFTQRGIDVYGACRSGGRLIYPTGGHGAQFPPYLSIAAAVTRHSDLLDMLDTYSVGYGDKVIDELDVPGGRALFFDRRGRDLSDPLQRWTHHRRFSVPVASTGTDTIDGSTYRWIDFGDVPDMALVSSFNTAGSLAQFHSFLDPSDQTTEQKIDQILLPTDNSSPADLRDETLNGLVVRGSGGVTRVFKTRVVSTSTGLEVTSQPRRNGVTLRVWLCDDVTSGTDASVDISPYVLEDITADRAFTDHTGDVIQSEWLFGAHVGPYDTTAMSCPILYGAIKQCADADGWTLPDEIEYRYRRMKARLSWSPGLWSFWNGRNNQYSFDDNSQPQFAWMTSRLPDAYGVLTRKQLPDATSSAGISRWKDGIESSATFPLLSATNITDISWMSRYGSSRGSTLFGASDSSTVSNLDKLLFVGSSGSTAFAGDRSTHIFVKADNELVHLTIDGTETWNVGNLKPLFIWPVGFDSPIECAPVQASSPRAWYVLPESKTLGQLLRCSWGAGRHMNIFFGISS